MYYVACLLVAGGCGGPQGGGEEPRASTQGQTNQQGPQGRGRSRQGKLLYMKLMNSFPATYFMLTITFYEGFHYSYKVVST